MKPFIALLAGALILAAQSPIRIDYACPPEDIDSFGLSCSSEDPCAVFLELASVEANGAKLFVTANLHTENTTLYGILLMSEDGGKTWTETVKRIRAAALEQIEFLDFAYGWISGQLIEPLPRDPFLLMTTDGGKTWREKAVFDDSRFGFISHFWFDSRSTGSLTLDHSGKQEFYQTNTGGESWERKETSDKRVALEALKQDLALRLRADGKEFHLERRGAPAWEKVASFAIHVADCK